MVIFTNIIEKSGSIWIIHDHKTVQIVTQYICCMMFSFLVKTFDGISLYFRFQEKRAKWYLMMCASTVIYVAAVFGVVQPELGTTHSSWIIRLGWISVLVLLSQRY